MINRIQPAVCLHNSPLLSHKSIGQVNGGLNLNRRVRKWIIGKNVFQKLLMMLE